MKFLRVLGILFGAYLALGLLIDSGIGFFQPQADGTVVLRSFDNAGLSSDTVLSLLRDEKNAGQLWVESGHWFRGWYRAVQANPDIELDLDGETLPYRAVPVDTPEALENVLRLMGKGSGAGYYIGRTMLLWAPIKPVRLDPREEEEIDPV